MKLGEELHMYLRSLSLKNLAQYIGVHERSILNWYKRGIPKAHMRGIMEFIELHNDNGLDLVLRIDKELKKK